MTDNRNIVNVNKLLHKYCDLRVSPEAIKELSGRIVDKLYDLAPEFDKTALKHGRKTVMEQDVIEVLGFFDEDVI